MNKLCFYFLLLFCGYTKNRCSQIVTSETCPKLCYTKLVNRICKTNGEITFYTDTDFAFKITTLQLSQLKKTPQGSPATAIYYRKRPNWHVGIIIKPEQMNSLKEMETTLTEKNLQYSYYLTSINTYSPQTLWDKTDSQKHHPKDIEIIQELDRQFKQGHFSSTIQTEAKEDVRDGLKKQKIFFFCSGLIFGILIGFLIPKLLSI